MIAEIRKNIDLTNKNAAKNLTEYREVKIGNTTYRVTSVFTGNFELAEALENLAVTKTIRDLMPSVPVNNQ